MVNCCLCGSIGDWQYSTNELLSKYFTSRTLCKCPDSSFVCDRCNWVLKGRVWFWNAAKNKWSDLPVRGITVLYSKNELLFPRLLEPRTERGKTWPVIESLALRSQIREWLLSPPEPPFTIAITESGQKYVLPWAQEGLDRDFFPVQFELDSVWIHRAEFTDLLQHYESLMGLGFSKTEIDSGQYHSDRLMSAISTYGQHEAIVAPFRGSRLLALVSHVAQKPIAQEVNAIVQDEIINPETTKIGQLSLF